MKKAIIILLAVFMLAGVFCACGTKGENKTNSSRENVSGNGEETGRYDENLNSERLSDNGDYLEGRESVGPNSHNSGYSREEEDLISLAEAIHEKEDLGTALRSNVIDLNDRQLLKRHTGLEHGEDFNVDDRIKAAVVYEPEINANTYSLVLVCLHRNEDAKSVADELRNKAGGEKWKDIENSVLRVATCGDKVMMAIVAEELNERGAEKTADNLVRAFEEICGR